MRRWLGTGLSLMILLDLLCGQPLQAQAKVKVAAVGASTTAGSGSSAGHHYPDELQRLLGAEYEVRNFGVGGTTLLRKGKPSYWATDEFKAALAYQPDIALIWFGGNDAKAENWTPYKGEFLGDYVSMIRMFQSLPTKPRTFVSVSVLMKDTGDIRKAVVDNEIGPLVRQAGAMTSSVVIDLRSQFETHPEYFNADGIHPNDRGTAAIAKYVHGVLIASLAADAGAPDSAPPVATPDAGALAPDAAVVVPADAAATPTPVKVDVGVTAPPRADAGVTSPDPENEPPARSPSAGKSGGCSVSSPGGSWLPLLVLAGLLLRLRRRRD
jgi:acyl-CoA thioesterase I